MPPSTDANSLAKKYVIMVFVWPNATTGRCEADHQIVNTPIGYEGNVRKPGAHSREMLFNVMDE